VVWMARGGVRGQAHRMTHRQLAAGSVDGYLDPVLAPAVSYFARLFNPASRGGGALAVRLKGQTMVDVWAGFADRRRSRPWERDTVTICFSTTKGGAATVIHRLADRGLVDYEAPVASYWPEFGVVGKQAITVRQLLSHQAGLHSMTDLVRRPEDLLDHIALEERLAARPPDPWPGHPGYHALTTGGCWPGWPGRSRGSAWPTWCGQSWLSPLRPTGCAWGGLPTAGLRRFAPPISWAPPIRPTPACCGQARPQVGACAPQTRTNPPVRRGAVRARPGPALDRAVAARVGHRDAVGERPPFRSRAGQALRGPSRRRCGRGCPAAVSGDGPRAQPGPDHGPRRRHWHAHAVAARLPPGGSARLPGTEAFGHCGYGGSGGWADRATGLSFGFVTNDLKLLQTPVGGRLGIPARSNHSRRPRANRAKITDKKIIDLYVRQRHSVNETATILRASTEYLRKRLKRPCLPSDQGPSSRRCCGSRRSYEI
jgi:CubicO group peptidase (beta-lactamase class C family)